MLRAELPAQSVPSNAGVGRRSGSKAERPPTPETVQAELEANVDAAGLSGAGAGAAGPAASRQQLQAYANRMMEKMEQQLRPILGARRR